MAVQMDVSLAEPMAVTTVVDWADALVELLAATMGDGLADHWAGLLGTA
jgi:hypothetical protein